METHVFTLPSGPECEITPFTGKEREIYTNRAYLKDNSMLPRLLKSMVVRIGSETNIRYNISTTDKDQSGFDVLDLLVEDVNYILLQAHRFDVDFEDVFTFDYEFKGYVQNSEDDKTIQVCKMHPISVNLADIEIVKPKSPRYEDGNLKFLELQFVEYKDVIAAAKHIPIRIDKVHEEFVFDMLTLRLNKEAERKKLTPSINSTLVMRNLRIRYDDKEVAVDLKSMRSAHIGKIQKFIKGCEGSCDLSVVVDNEYYLDSMPINDSNLPKISFNLLSVPDFLFQGVI